MKILITGGSGFIGKNLSYYLRDKYDIETPQRSELDLLNTKAVEQYLKGRRIDIIIHAANINDVKNKGIAAHDVLDGNLRMFNNLQRCQNYYKKMYYFGSGAEYDSQNYIPSMKEEYFDTYIPEDSYGFSKYIMSKYCSSMSNVYDLRLFGVYGKYEEWERRFISNAICRILKGKDILIHRNVYFDYLWVEDLCNIMQWFIQNTPRYHHYNVCTGHKIDLYSLACIIKEVMNADCNIYIEETGFKREYTGDNTRLLAEIGKYEFVDFESSIIKLVEFYEKCIDKIDENKLI